jgi:hypothetical protein
MTANTTSVFVRWLVIVVLATATAGMVAVSLRANYLFGYGFGQSEEKAHVFGWANVAADLWKVSGLIVLTSLWRSQQRRIAIALIPIWLLCLLWGLAGAIGVYAQDRTALIGARQATAATLRDVEQELAFIAQRLEGLTQRSVAQVDAAIATVLARPIKFADRIRGTVGKISANCTKEERTTADACAEVAVLREERASAVEAEGLLARRRLLEVQVTRLRETGGSLAADPVAELFAWLSRGQLSVRDISFGFPLFFAVLVELVSAFGPTGVVAYAEATRRPTSVTHLSRPVATGRDLSRIVGSGRDNTDAMPHEGRVAHYMADRTEPANGPMAVGAEELFADYEQWCAANDLRALTLVEFVDELDSVRESPRLAGKITKFGSRYFGIALVADARAETTKGESELR